MGAACTAVLALLAAADPGAVRTAVDLGVSTEGRSVSVDVAARPLQERRELLVVPSLRLAVASRSLDVAAAYAPRLVASFDEQGAHPRAVHEGRLRLEAKPGTTWSLRAAGNAAYGAEYRAGGQATGASGLELTPAGLVDFFRWDAALGAEARPARRWRLDAEAGWRASGGVGADAPLLPREEGPRARLAVAWDATRRNAVGVVLDASASAFTAGQQVGLASASGTWAAKPARDVEAALALGAAAARELSRGDAAPPGADRLAALRPVARASLSALWSGATSRLRTELAAESTPTVDRWSRRVRAWDAARAGVAWSGGGGWRLDASALGALQVDRREVMARIGAVEARAAYRLGPGVAAVVGTRVTWQRGVAEAVSSFVQWDAFAGLALEDRPVLGNHPAPGRPEPPTPQGESTTVETLSEGSSR